MTAPRLPFDRVVVQLESGERQMSVPEFMRIPLAERIRHILKRHLQFFLGDAPVDQRLALAALRESWVTSDDAGNP